MKYDTSLSFEDEKSDHDQNLRYSRPCKVKKTRTALMRSKEDERRHKKEKLRRDIATTSTVGQTFHHDVEVKLKEPGSSL